MATANYDGLARDYAQHRRAVPSLTGALLQGGSLTRGSRVLELGCRAGKYICVLEDAAGCACWGIARSGEMLGRAQARDPSARPVAGVLRQTVLWASKPDRASSTGSPLGSPLGTPLGTRT